MLGIRDGIFVVENIYSHMIRGQARREAVRAANAEISRPVMAFAITPMVILSGSDLAAPAGAIERDECLDSEQSRRVS